MHVKKRIKIEIFEEIKKTINVINIMESITESLQQAENLKQSVLKKVLKGELIE